MRDEEIVELYRRRDERAIEESQKKYGEYCRAAAWRLLGSELDAQECENDAYAGAWNAIPPHSPKELGPFLAKIARRAAMKKLRERAAEKRGGGELPAPFEELSECLPAREDTAAAAEGKELAAAVNAFLSGLPETERRMFVRRYWWAESVSEIAERFGCGESKVKMKLARTRKKLRARLEREGLL